MKKRLIQLKSLYPKQKLLRFYEPLIISFLALFLFASPIFFGPSRTQINWQHVFNVWLMLVPYVILYLINRFVFLPYLLLKNKQLAFIFCSSLLILGMAYWLSPHFDHRHKMEEDFQEFNRPFNHPPELPPNRIPEFDRPLGMPGGGPPIPGPKELPPFLSFIIVGVLIVGFDTGLRLWVKWIQSEQQIAKAEKENIQSQLALLRTQISPHFFMNTLNNIHALIEYDTEGAQNSIIRLSKMMRHLLYESERGQIELKKEMDFVENYVDLMKIRFAKSVDIMLDIPDNIPQKMLPPLLFTSFIENAFKHGISYQEKSYIQIAFKFDENHLYMEIENSNHHIKQQDGQHGLGVKNSRQRLNILYNDDYSLHLLETHKTFKVKLNIPL